MYQLPKLGGRGLVVVVVGGGGGGGGGGGVPLPPYNKTMYIKDSYSEARLQQAWSPIIKTIDKIVN